MKGLMKSAVNALYRLLWQRDNDPAAYQETCRLYVIGTLVSRPGLTDEQWWE
jgi:hypothetical protein